MNTQTDDTAQAGVENPEAEGVEAFTEADAEAAFAIGLGESASEKPEETIPPESGTPKGSEITGETGPTGEAVDTETPEESDKSKGDLSSTQPADKSSIKPADKSSKPTYEEIEQQLADTKAWGTQLSQTVADLKKQIETKPPGKPDEKETPSEEEIPEEVKDYLKDYPEAQKAIDFFAQQMLKKTLGDLDPKNIQETIIGMQKQLSQANFEKAVISGFIADGKWIDGHPDAYKIMSTKEYGDWFRAETKRDPTLGDISDPGKAIDVLTRFKSHKAGAAAAAHDADLGGGIAQDVKDIASSAVPAGTHQDTTPKPKDEDKSPEEIFEEHAT